MQVKLLRALQEGEVDAVGSRRPTKVDVRIISATNRNLAQQVETGTFREDLFYRLNVFPIDMPSLRQRKEDIPALVEHFITRFNASEGTKINGASKTTLNMLSANDWPGNVRQLENAIFRAVVLCEGNELQPEDFPQISGLQPTLSDPAPSLSAANDAGPAPANDAAGSGPIAVFKDDGEMRELVEVERDLLQLAIDHYDGHMSEVSRRLGIGRSTLYRKVREYDLKVRDEKKTG